MGIRIWLSGLGQGRVFHVKFQRIPIFDAFSQDKFEDGQKKNYHNHTIPLFKSNSKFNAPEDWLRRGYYDLR